MSTPETHDNSKPPLADATGSDGAVEFWIPIICISTVILLACILCGQGASAIAVALVIHAEIRLLEHDEKCHQNSEVSSGANNP
jgi:hypothetical protein